MYVCLSERLSVYPSVGANRDRDFFGGFDIGLPFLAHGCITMRRCVAHINDSDTTLTFDHMVKFIGFFYMFSCPVNNGFFLV